MVRGVKVTEEQLDEIIERSKGPDEAIETIKKLREKTLDSRTLPMHEQEQLILFMRLNSFPVQQIAQLMGRNHSWVNWMMGKVKRFYAEEVARGGWQSILGRLMIAAQFISDNAVKDKNWSLAWKVESELFDRLQRVGMVPEAAKEFVFSNGNSSDETKGFEGDEGRAKLAGLLGEFAQRITEDFPGPNQGKLPS